MVIAYSMHVTAHGMTHDCEVGTKMPVNIYTDWLTRETILTF